MLLDNKFFSLLFNNIAFGLGLVLLLLGIYLLNQPEVEEDYTVDAVNVGTVNPVNKDGTSFSLEYDKVFVEEEEKDKLEYDKLIVEEEEKVSLEHDKVFVEDVKADNLTYGKAIDENDEEEASLEQNKVIVEEADNLTDDKAYVAEDTADEVGEKDSLEQNKVIVEDDAASEVEEIIITIPYGSNGNTVAEILDKNGLLKYDEFKDYLILFDIEHKIRAGRYKFDKANTTAIDILDKILIKGR